MAEHRILATPAGIKIADTETLREVVEDLKGHGGYNPFWPCDLCKLKDDVRAELERRG